MSFILCSNELTFHTEALREKIAQAVREFMDKTGKFPGIKITTSEEKVANLRQLIRDVYVSVEILH